MNKEDLLDFTKGLVDINMSNTTPEDWVDLINQFDNIGHDLNADAKNYMDLVSYIKKSYDIKIDRQCHEFVRFMNYFKQFSFLRYLFYSPILKDVCMDNGSSKDRRQVAFTPQGYNVSEFELGF